MTFWTVENLREITNARWLARAASARPAPLTGLCTDTRTLQPGQAFLALHGEHFDGHRFLHDAVQAGSPLLIVDEADPARDLPHGSCDVVQVADTQRALTQLAAAYRLRLGGRVIAVTGSAGKTTVKHLVHAILGRHFHGHASPKSFNNHIGVPLTLLAAKPGDAYIVVEIGTNAPGEIAALARIAQPDIAVITHIGAAHLQGLGSLDAILREKASLLNHLRPGGVGIINGDIPGLRAYRKVVQAMISFGATEGCDLRMSDYQPEPTGSRFHVNARHAYHVPLLGRHNALNALAAIAVARHMQLAEGQIADALAHVTPPPMRLEPQTLGSPGDPVAVTLINDAYNANPDSMAAALNILADYPAPGRRVAILGDMLELGDEAVARHRALGEQALAARLDAVAFAGPLSRHPAEVAAAEMPPDRVLALPDWPHPHALQRAAAIVRPGDTLLLKGSRAMQIERVIPAIQRRLTPAASSSRA